MVEATFPGVDVQVELERGLVSMPALARGRARKRIAGCRGCELAAPVPPTLVPDSLFLAVGEAPGPDEDRLGAPFVGKSGRLLRQMMQESGLDVSRVSFGNTVSCFPNENGRIRKPTRDEVDACRGNLELQLETADYVLLVGGVALKSFRDDLDISQARGRVMVWRSRWVVMPVFHPAACLRNRSLIPMTKADLMLWRGIVGEELDPLTLLGDTCIKCGEWMEGYDQDGVPYCAMHMARRREVLEKQAKKKRKKLEQEGML